MLPRPSKDIYKPYLLFVKCKNNLLQSGSIYYGSAGINSNLNKICFYSSGASRIIPGTLFPVFTESAVLAFLWTKKRYFGFNPNSHLHSREPIQLNENNRVFLQKSLNTPHQQQQQQTQTQSVYKLPTYFKTFYDPILLSLPEKIDNFEEINSMKNSNNSNKKNKKQNWNDLPDDDQMNDMMYYFHEQAPKLFTPHGWSYVRCSYKVNFENRLIGTKSETLNSYILQINTMKKITSFFLYNPKLNILRMTKSTLDGSIQVRWQVSGVARYIKPLAKIGLVDESESVRHIDGLSVFYMKNDGLYYRHVLMKMTPMKSEDFRPVYSQIFSNFMYKPSLQPSLETNVSNRIKWLFIFCYYCDETFFFKKT